MDELEIIKMRKIGSVRKVKVSADVLNQNVDLSWFLNLKRSIRKSKIRHSGQPLIHY